MAIVVKCSGEGCGKALKVKDELAGRKVKCPHCQSVLTIPAAVAPVPLPAPPPPLPPSVDDAETDAPPVRSKKRGRSAGSPDVLSRPRLVVKAKGFSFKLSGAARVTHHVFEPGKKEPLAVVRREKKPFDFMALLGLSKKPTRLDIREEEDGPNLFSMLLSKTAMSQLWSKGPAQVDIELLDGEDEPLGKFRFRGGLLSSKATLKFEDADGEELAEVSRLGSREDGIGLALAAPDGHRIGTVRTEMMSEAADAMKDGKVRFSMSVGGGSDGHVAEVDPQSQGDLTAHRLALALAVICEATNIGRKETGAERMGPPRRRR